MLLQHLSVVGVGDLDQLLGTVGQALTGQERHTVLRHHIVHVSSGANDTGTLSQSRHDAWVSPVGSGRQSQDGLAARRQSGSSQEVNLATEAGEDALTDGVASRLPGDINLDRRVDRSMSGHWAITPGWFV